MRFILAILMSLLIGSPCLAWSEGGHHLIASLAFDLLTVEEQNELLFILSHHPRFEADFAPPKKVSEPEEMVSWRIGRAGYWPDVARSQPAFNRPSWHYQLGSSLTIGEVENVPRGLGEVPKGATLATKKLHIAQAVQLSRKILKDKTQPVSDRALAISWLAHLVADAHQPCHAGSLYVSGIFDEGDRGGNSIPTKQGKNLHALWDGLLGQRFDAGDIRRRSREITSSPSWVDAGADTAADISLDPLHWLAESAEYGRSYVYAPEVLSAVEAAARGPQQLETVNLSEEYLSQAGTLARARAAFAAHRLAGILQDGLGPL